jgi:Cof subfamily protein (haloacid dehalogenase superfamily)
VKYDLVAFDFDGTLVGRDLSIHGPVRAAIAAMQARGVIGTIVTGRMYRATAPHALDLGFRAPLVCYQGAAIFDPASDAIVREVPLANAVVLDVIEAAARANVHLQLYRDDSYYCESENRFSKLYASLAGIEPSVVRSLREAFASSGATKALAIADPERAAVFAAEMTTLLGDRAYVTRSYPEFVEILNPAVDKGEALRFVADRLSIDMSRVLAIGDSWNDAPLLRAVGFAVAMGSAPPELRADADAVVADVEGDGVAEALERYVL